jgi:hypothetical protein
LNRRVSPLLHDYKQTAPEATGKSKRLQWFVVGLGLPLVGLLLMWAFSSPTNQPSLTAEVTDNASAAPAIPLAEASLPALDTDLELIELATAKPMPEMKPVSPYSELQFRVRPGDTLDRLFRTHKLDLGNLATIASLPEAGKHLRMLRPGDEFRIEHDEGKLISLYRDLDINNALLVSRGESGFAAEIITRPIEIQKRLSYGRIETSLFESAAAAGMPDKLIMNLAGIFAWDVDFVLDIRKGDDYYILYEEIYQNGRFVTSRARSSPPNSITTTHFPGGPLHKQRRPLGLFHAGRPQRAQGLHPRARRFHAHQLQFQSAAPAPDPEHDPRPPGRRLRCAPAARRSRPRAMARSSFAAARAATATR